MIPLFWAPLRSHEITRVDLFWQVLTDRTFLSKPREMLLSFIVGGVVSARSRRLEPRRHERDPTSGAQDGAMVALAPSRAHDLERACGLLSVHDACTQLL